jgi:hypothetical protein
MKFHQNRSVGVAHSKQIVKKSSQPTREIARESRLRHALQAGVKLDSVVGVARTGSHLLRHKELLIRAEQISRHFDVS